MKNITHVFFDLDHTLWDYDRNAQETLSEIHSNLELQEFVELEKFIKSFYSINDELWTRFNSGLIQREDIQRTRFASLFEKLGIRNENHLEISRYFVTFCSSKPHLMPEAIDALEYLKRKYRLHIITNGFKDVQPQKLKSSGIEKYFEIVVTSDGSKSRKPSPGIFEYALKLVEGKKEECVMIGDNPKTDIHGARDFGFRTILFDPSGKKRSMADATIQSLSELIRIL